jgi:hypothetical protein
LRLDLSLISMASILLPAVFGAVFFRHLPFVLRILVFYVFTAVIAEGIGYVCYITGTNNMPLFHAHTFVQSAFLILIYYQLFQTIWSKRILLIGFAVFTGYTLFDVLCVTSLFEPNSIIRTIQAALMIVLCIAFAFSINKSDRFLTRHRRSYSILNFGLLTYFTGTILVSYYSYQLMEDELYTIWFVHSILNISINILYAVIIWNSIGLRQERTRTIKNR